MVNARGFTMVEMLVTISIVGILAAIAYPSFARIIQRTRIKSESNLISTDLFYMRGEAMKRSAVVSMCPSSDGASCTGGSWSSGRIIFSDQNADGLVTVGKDTVLQVRPATAGTSSIAVTGFGAGTYIQYTPTGQVVAAGLIKICDSVLSGASGISQSVLITGLVHATSGLTCP